MKTELDYALRRVIEHDDHLDHRRARRAHRPDPDAVEPPHCTELFGYVIACDQCGRRTRGPHLLGIWAYCARCCPTCAAGGVGRDEPIVAA